MILDTNVIIDILRGTDSVKKKIVQLEKVNTPLFFTSISVFEVWQGTSDILDSKKLEKIHNLLSSMNCLNLDILSAKEAGLIHSELRKKGNLIEAQDSMIAGIAKIYNETLLTKNLKHFERIPNLDLESY